MKKLIIILSIVFVAVLFAACEKHDDLPKGKNFLIISPNGDTLEVRKCNTDYL